MRRARNARSAPILARLLALLATIASVTASAEPLAPKLEDLERDRAPSAERPGEPALRLPERLTVCIDRNGGRCWSAVVENDCRAAGGEVFSTVANADSGDAGALLARCADEARGSRKE